VVVDYNRGVKARIALLALAALLLASCLPKPGKSIEWLHRDDSIIVQIRTMGLPGNDIERRTNVPYLTLYGDGTLLAKTAPATSQPLHKAKLADGDIKNLLKFINGTEFFNFNYSQPKPEVDGEQTTYVYVALKDKANAVSAYALDATVLDGNDWATFRKLQEITLRLDMVVQNALSDPATTPFVPASGALLVGGVDVEDLAGVPEWPFPQIDIGAATASLTVTERPLSPAERGILELYDPSLVECWCQYQAAGRLVSVWYVPVLPFQENFPEFDNG